MYRPSNPVVHVDDESEEVPQLVPFLNPVSVTVLVPVALTLNTSVATKADPHTIFPKNVQVPVVHLSTTMVAEDCLMSALYPLPDVSMRSNPPWTLPVPVIVATVNCT